MTQPQPLDLDQIEARAAAATPGPWGVYEYGGDSLIEIAADLEDTGCGYRARRTVCRFDEEPLDNDPTHREWTAEEDWAQVQADAAFIAAMSPETVKAMAAEIRRLRAELATARDRYTAGLRKADEHVNAMSEELKRYADGEETPVLWSVYNAMHSRAATAEGRVAELETAMRQIRHLHKDSPMGPCPVCIDADAAAAGGDGLVPYPCPTARLAGAQDCDPPSFRAAARP
jgi:hypothetical protein